MATYVNPGCKEGGEQAKQCVTYVLMNLGGGHVPKPLVEKGWVGETHYGLPSWYSLESSAIKA